ncbi:MAG: capsular polysaccharide biosynthesis protein [Rhodobacteraceae bacterium]|nr:capsular polysaccharide biosynthesis protein [Paracoccaceae bacterium]
MTAAGDAAAKDGARRRLHVYSGGFLTEARVRRILSLAGYDLRIGIPPADGLVGVWGQSPTAARGEAVADRAAARIVRVEDAFLRSIRPGREAGGPPLGLLIDGRGVHFDPSQPSELEHILATAPLDDSAVLSRARDGIERLKAAHLSKYNLHDPAIAPPPPGYVLVIDQTRGDASVTASGATEATFREMLVMAREEHPGARIVIRAHPETVAGRRPGYYGDGHDHGTVSLCREPVSPWALLEGAVAVYTVSSQMGFEAILAGHRPRVFGQPFYAGWGLTEDERPVARRRRRLTRPQLFAAAMILAPVWYDPCRDRLCPFEDALDHLEAQVMAFRADRRGHVAVGMRLWKRPHLARAFGTVRPLRFAPDLSRGLRRAEAEGRDLLVWGDDPAGSAPVLEGIRLRRVEDGFLRSRGLGADLVPPLSLVADDLGMYYDPSRESRLERLIAAGCPPWAEARAERLIARIVRAGLTKYTPEASLLPDLPAGRRILVPGQVEDDASIRHGARAERTNLAALARARRENPGAVILYKPHPDVEAGLRPGSLEEDAARESADMVLRGVNPAQIIEAVDEVWTITSGLGFEALIRGRKVVTLGVPWYSGWGLTHDLAPQPARRRARPTLAALAHAALVAYPRYVDPVSGLVCPVEVAVDRLARRDIPRPGRPNRLLARLQGALAGQSWLWR